MKANQTNHCYNCRGRSKKVHKRLRNRAQRRTPRCAKPGRCMKGYAD